MVEVKPIELDDRTKKWIEWFSKLKKETDKYIQSKIGMTKEQLGKPKR